MRRAHLDRLRLEVGLPARLARGLAYAAVEAAAEGLHELLERVHALVGGWVVVPGLRLAVVRGREVRGDGGRVVADVVEDARRTLESVVSAVPAGVETHVLVSSGSAARTILEHAADVDADLVVVGRSQGFKMLGSTALRVLRKNDRALLVIPSTANRTGRIERQRAAGHSLRA